jgi:hypothetical protein
MSSADSSPPSSRPPFPSDDDFDAPESSSFKKLVHHIIDEMPGHVTIAVAMVAFMFFYGMANSVQKLVAAPLDALFLKWFDKHLGATSPAVGPWTGLLGAVLITIAILRVKYRKK